MSAVPLHTDERIARLTMISTVFWAVEKHHGTSDIITREGPLHRTNGWWWDNTGKFSGEKKQVRSIRCEIVIDRSWEDKGI